VTDIKFPLALSVVGHAVILACLAFLLSGRLPPTPLPIAKGGIEVAFERELPKSETTSLPSPPAEAPAPEPPPEAAVPPAETIPPVPTVASEPALPVAETPVAASEPPAPAAQPQTAAAPTPVPAPVPSPEASAGYQALLRAWLDGHKRYPDSARERGEEGRAVLRFEVDRSGRVLDYAVTSSTGYPELDQSIDEMMRGAMLPPFPAGMLQPRLQVSVTIRFSLRR
jgi:periplasmic protein TonB